jgi:hypothetical protein
VRTALERMLVLVPDTGDLAGADAALESLGEIALRARAIG